VTRPTFWSSAGAVRKGWVSGAVSGSNVGMNGSEPLETIAIDRVDDPARAFDLARRFIEDDPIANNVVATLLCEYRIRGRRLTAWIAAAEGRPVGLAVRTPGRAINLAAAARPVAAALAAWIANEQDEYPGVSGLADVASCFAANWGLHRGIGIAVNSASRLMVFDASSANAAAHKVLRRADVSDRLAVAALFERFLAETGDDPSGAQSIVDERLPEGRYWLCETPMGPVTLLAVTLPVLGVVRIQGAYTLPDRRNHGFAMAGSAAIGQMLAAQGQRTMLLTDLANPMSNRAFFKAGFRPVAEKLSYDFGAQSPVAAH